MKKIISIIFVLLLLCSCFKKIETIQETNSYIKPLNEINYYDSLNDELKNKLKDIYPEGSVNNYFMMLDEPLKELETKDINDKTIYFSDFLNQKVVFEIVQFSCEHCKAQIELTEKILEKENDIVFIQYFAFGDKDEIKEFYASQNASIPNNIIVIPHDDEVSKYFLGIGVADTPTFVFYDNGRLSLAKIGLTNLEVFNTCKEVAYNNILSKDKLITNNGEKILDIKREYNDVLNDLSSTSKDKLAKIANSEQLTVDVIGQYVEFYKLYEAEDESAISFDSYIDYVNKPLAIFYIGNIKNNIEEDIELINTFKQNHKDLNILTILIDNDDVKTSEYYLSLDTSLITDVVSSSSEIPQQFIDTKVYEYPSVLFIQDNVFTGGFYNISSLETLEFAYNTFIGEDCIALERNNEKS